MAIFCRGVAGVLTTPKTAYRCAVVFASTIGAFGFSFPANAQTHLSKSTKAEHELFLQGHVRTNSNCEGIDPPKIYIDPSPEHGIVCLRRAGVWLTKVVESSLTNCLGRKASGIHVIYVPRAGYAGLDKVRYTAQYPTVQHSVEVDLTVLPDDSSPGGVLKNIDASAGKNGQILGPIPECSALVS